MKRRPFTFVELILSLMLLALLLTTLFGWTKQITWGKSRLKKMEWTLNEERYFDIQMEKILSKANCKPCFYTRDQGLVFTFDNGVQKDPALSSTVLGRLYFDQATHTVCLGIWPVDGKKEPSHSRKLLEDVDAMRLHFYWPPNPFGLTVDPEQVGTPIPKEGWEQEWAQAYNQIPPLMKIELQRGKKKILLVYELPLSQKSRIVYKGED